MMRLGITGGIGSGKSYVCHILQEHFQVPVYNCDIHAAILMRSDWEIIEALTAINKDFYDSEGELNKPLLAHYLFSSEENARHVNGIVHPAVRKDLREWIDSRAMSHSTTLVAVESAILYESQFDQEVDKVLFVDAPLNLRIQRTCQRDGLTEEDVLARIHRQQTELSRLRADYILTNDGQTNIVTELAEILKSLTNKPLNH